LTRGKGGGCKKKKKKRGFKLEESRKSNGKILVIVRLLASLRVTKYGGERGMGVDDDHFGAGVGGQGSLLSPPDTLKVWESPGKGGKKKTGSSKGALTDLGKRPLNPNEPLLYLPCAR